MPFFSRIWFAFVAAFRVLFDGVWARRVANLDAAPVVKPAEVAPTPAPAADEPPSVTAAPAAPTQPPSAPDESALLLLGLLQREGRLIDFIEQDVVGFSDADVGTAARVVHEGCRRTLRQHFRFEPIRSEAEGTQLRLEPGFDVHSYKLVGDLGGAGGALRGTLKHPGWRASDVKLPTRVGDHDPAVIAPAEIEVQP